MYLTGIWIYTYLIFIGIPHDVSAMYFGQLAQEGQFKYMAGIARIDGTQCSGAIIGPYHILTAASCVTRARPNEIIVTVGTVDLTSASRIDHTVQKIHIHSRFKEWKKKGHTTGCLGKSKYRPEWFLRLRGKKLINHDIAVIKLSRSLPLGENIASLILPCDSSIPECTPLDFSGWGKSIWNDDSRLKYAKMIVYTPPLKDVLFPGLKNGFYANGNNEEIIASDGDIGSPLVLDDIVHGIFVHGRGRNKTYKAIFLKVYDYRHFIKRTMDASSG